MRGTVIDQTGETVIGASIQLKGTTQGTITDIDGKFSLGVPDKKAVIIVSFIGYATKELQVDTTKPMSIVLEEDTKVLDEVVVVGGRTYCRCERVFQRRYAGRNHEHRDSW